jgi:3-hydroxybutyrate dehydrogenase
LGQAAVARYHARMANSASLKGRVALVTGSTSGIGLGIAQALAAEGAAIVFNGFGDAAEIERTRAAVAEKHGVGTAYHGADMSRPAEIEAMVAHAERTFGRVDILVNNAGVQHVAPIEDFPPAAWDRIIAINLSSSFHTIRVALPGMRARDWGRIVNVASVHGLVASTHKSAYVAAKHGLIGLTKVVALETARSGITANAICPGWVLTAMVQKQIEDLASQTGKSLDDARLELLGLKQPSMDFATTDQIGALAVFLCSPAASQIRGAAYTIDGGWSAQ